MVAAQKDGTCPDAATGCALGAPICPCVYSSSDVPFNYYPASRDNPATLRDFARLQTDLQGGLPAVSFVKALGFRTEPPGSRDTISDGVAFVSGVVSAIGASAYAKSTLVLVAYDEGGGYFDHITPPPVSSVDGQPYGARLPFLALGPFARRGAVSHRALEHASIVRFIEWNWLGGATGQLAGRDATVNNLGSLLDPAVTGVVVPE